jgi:T-complex protein 1 subunit zeta
MTGVQTLNANAEVMGRQAALFMNINAAKGLEDVMKTNLGPKGTIKMLVGGAGGDISPHDHLDSAQQRQRQSSMLILFHRDADIKLTKDGNVLLREMQITNPTALMIARTAVAQDDVTGDGTTSTVLLIGELLRHSERHLQEGLHPRLIVEGLDVAKDATLAFLDKFAKTVEPEDTEMLQSLARTALATKLPPHLADVMTDAVVQAVLCIRQPDAPIDLHMVEIMHMRHKLDTVRLIAFLLRSELRSHYTSLDLQGVWSCAGHTAHQRARA